MLECEVSAYASGIDQLTLPSRVNHSIGDAPSLLQYRRITFGLLLCAACCGAVRSQAESLEEKLGTATDYVPQAIAPADQLVEVAQRFEQVAIDVMIEGLLNQRMTTIPVMLEYGLAGNCGGTTTATSSEGESYDYGACVAELGKDSATLSVHLTVRRSGEAEFKFDRKLKVSRGQVSELRPEFRIRILAYIEPRSESLRDHGLN